jgi:SAM-dependent methyltransferase
MPERISEKVWRILACPRCGGPLARAEGAAGGARCPGCGEVFGRNELGQLDLRLRESKRCRLEVEVPGSAAAPLAGGMSFKRLRRRAAPEVDVTRVKGPCHLPQDLRSYFPRARGGGADGARGSRDSRGSRGSHGSHCSHGSHGSDGSHGSHASDAEVGGGEPHGTGGPGSGSGGGLALDLGCGAAVHQEVCELAGFEYVGLDYATPEAMVLGDAQALPFAGASFELVLSIAVLEHVPFPLLMLREAWRTLEPGGAFLGTVAFLEPFHQESYYHHTHLGLLSALRHAGFAVERIAPAGGWPGLAAQANMGLFPGSPRWLSGALVAPLLALHKLWWRAGRLVEPAATESRRMLENSGALIFLARKPGAP